MLLRLKTRLETIQQGLKENDPEIKDYMAGTLAVIEGSFDFRKTDGFIMFLKMALEYISEVYGRQDPKWASCLCRISEMADKLKDSNTRFTGCTKDEFRQYCDHVSKILDSDVDSPITAPALDITKTDDLVPFIEKHLAAGNTLGFYYEGFGEHEDIMKDLMEQLSSLKLEKTSRKYNISNFLTVTGYHEHIHDALNVLIQCGVYAINCSSTRERKVYSFDTQKVHNELQYAELIIKRIKDLV